MKKYLRLSSAAVLIGTLRDNDWLDISEMSKKVGDKSEMVSVSCNSS